MTTTATDKARRTPEGEGAEGSSAVGSSRKGRMRDIEPPPLVVVRFPPCGIPCAVHSSGRLGAHGCCQRALRPPIAPPCHAAPRNTAVLCFTADNNCPPPPLFCTRSAGWVFIRLYHPSRPTGRESSPNPPAPPSTTLSQPRSPSRVVRPPRVHAHPRSTHPRHGLCTPSPACPIPHHSTSHSNARIRWSQSGSRV